MERREARALAAGIRYRYVGVHCASEVNTREDNEDYQWGNERELDDRRSLVSAHGSADPWGHHWPRPEKTAVAPTATGFTWKARPTRYALRSDIS